jgi:hypothetical protein
MVKLNERNGDLTPMDTIALEATHMNPRLKDCRPGGVSRL